jgi:formylglycine-generating enzyme required for sulfatase activity
MREAPNADPGEAYHAEDPAGKQIRARPWSSFFLVLRTTEFFFFFFFFFHVLPSLVDRVSRLPRDTRFVVRVDQHVRDAIRFSLEPEGRVECCGVASRTIGLFCERVGPRERRNRRAMNIERPGRSAPTILDDLVAWNAASRGEQDEALVAAAEMLGPGFELTLTRAYACGGREHRIATFRISALGLDLNLIPGGTYVMGTDTCCERERPEHGVLLPPFLIGVFPLTQRDWDRLGGTGDRRSVRGPGMAIDGIDWRSAKALLAKAGEGLRLPSESEWEYACRAGTSTRHFWGDAMDGAYCWYGRNSGHLPHRPTDHKRAANAFGLVDMLGNVLEWCEDDWILGYTNGPRDEVARGDGGSPEAVIRGGFFDARVPGPGVPPPPELPVDPEQDEWVDGADRPEREPTPLPVPEPPVGHEATSACCSFAREGRDRGDGKFCGLRVARSLRPLRGGK